MNLCLNHELRELSRAQFAGLPTFKHRLLKSEAGEDVNDHPRRSLEIKFQNADSLTVVPGSFKGSVEHDCFTED